VFPGTTAYPPHSVQPPLAPPPIMPTFAALPSPPARCPLRRAQRARSRHGFTMLELMLTVAIVAVLTAIAIPAYHGYQERLRIFNATRDIASIAALIAKHQVDQRVLPDSLADVGAETMRDPWGNAYQYVNHDAPHSRGRWRRDKNIVPINNDFDLFSMGADGESRPPLTARASRDDIVRANNGRFVGLASDYDP